MGIMAKTKIICTIGPAINSLEKIMELMRLGMNVARLNFSHGTHEEHGKMIELCKQARGKLNLPLAIMLDTRGPEIRLQKLSKEIKVSPGDRIWLCQKETPSNSEKIAISPPEVIPFIPNGCRVLIDDGNISAHVVEAGKTQIEIEIENCGTLSSQKAVAFLDVDIPLRTISESDIADIRFGCQQNVDYIAVSFVRTPQTLLAIKNLLIQEKKADIQLAAKIEDGQAVNNFDAILENSDLVMVARGDLGVSMDLSELPHLQKMILQKSLQKGKPAIVATQILQTMTVNPRPTRAEVLDCANALFDTAAALMLSSETAIGKFPCETVKMMRKILERAERDFPYSQFFNSASNNECKDVKEASTIATVRTAYSLNAQAIICFTQTGTTPRLLSRLRPSMPILAFTTNEKTYHRLSIDWGVTPILIGPEKSFKDAFRWASRWACDQKLVTFGDTVVVIDGSSLWGNALGTIFVEHVGEVLMKGTKGHGEPTSGKISFVQSKDCSPYHVKNRIIVIDQCDEKYSSFIKECAGIILQNDPTDLESEHQAEWLAKEHNKPIVLRATKAPKNMVEDLLVTLHPEKICVFSGTTQE